MKNLILPKLYQKVQEEVDVLEPILLALNFGKGSANQEHSGGFRDAKRAKTTAGGNVIDSAATHGSIESCFRISYLVAQGKERFP